MPNKQIVIKPGTCTLTPIDVKPPGATIPPGDGIRFNNNLNAGGSQPDALLRFYDLDAKPEDDSDLGNPIAGFCQGTAGTVLTVPATGGGTVCIPANAGNYAYTIQADGYAFKDPVLIIEESFDVGIGPPTISIPVFGIGLLVAIVLGYLAGRYLR